jgi:hypothetical protein
VSGAFTRLAAIARFAPTRAAAKALFDGVGGASLGGVPRGVVAGTAIATENGPVAAEELRGGEIIAGGGRVASVSLRIMDAAALARDADARPVRIAAGAFADGVPAHAVSVAPAQLLLVDGDAVPAAALVNGASVARMPAEPAVTYVELRLDGPGCFIAGGIACDGFGLRPAGAAAIARIRAVIDARAGLVHGPLDGDAAEVDRRGAYGWALDTTRPAAPVALEYVVNGATSGHAIADVRRPDLEMAGLAEGRCGFRLRLRHPLPVSRPALVELRRTGDGAPLPRMPLLLPPPVGAPKEFNAALAKEAEAAAQDDTLRAALALFLADAVDRLLQARSERPRSPRAPAS